MAYEITKTDGTTLIEVEEGLTDTSAASITFIGKNVVNYGEIQNTNLLHVLENFANDTEPPNKLTGQLWFDTSPATGGGNTLKVYSGSAWKNVASLTYGTSSTGANSQGNLWFDSANKQLHINNGSTFDLIGPEKVLGFGVTRLVSVSILDTGSTAHPIIQCYVDDEIVAIISKVAFIINAASPITGFNSLAQGITLKSGYTLSGKSTAATNADKLLSADSSDFINASTGTTANSIAQRDFAGNVSASGLKTSSISSIAASGNISGIWRVANSLTPAVDGQSSLGSSSYKWGNVYASSSEISTATISKLSATTATVININFTNLSDSEGTIVSKIDADGTLSENSDSNLSTQKAIKKYIDDTVAAEVAARVAENTTLNQRITNFGYPLAPGTIFFTASTDVPPGFLPADGSYIDKAEYYSLFLALGGDSSPFGSIGETFRLPDLRGEFIRGWDNGRGVDPSRSFASVQTSANIAHNHGYPGDDQLAYASGVAAWSGVTRGAFSYDARSVLGGGGQIWETTTDGLTESRPRNIALFAIIKY